MKKAVIFLLLMTALTVGVHADPAETASEATTTMQQLSVNLHPMAVDMELYESNLSIPVELGPLGGCESQCRWEYRECLEITHSCQQTICQDVYNSCLSNC